MYRDGKYEGDYMALNPSMVIYYKCCAEAKEKKNHLPAKDH